jgi:type IV pilus assembly protein PilB
MIPLELRDQVLTIGMVDPFNDVALRAVQRVLTHAQPNVVAISQDDFNSTKRRLKIHTPTAQGRREQRIDPNLVAFEDAESKRESERALQRAGEQVVTLAAQVVAAALERGASDIHLEPIPRSIRVRFRVNGTLSEWEQSVQPQLARALVARFKVLAGLDIAEKRRPQDGRISVRVGRRRVDLRVSTLPSSEGEKIAMRILEASTMLRALDQIFVEQRTLSAIRETLQRPYGAIVVAGPTGSGKTSTLYAALHERQTVRPDTNIITVEDPIEYRLDEITQVQVNHSIGLGFAEVLRSMLRQDPDVLMVGEVRDAETAQLALESLQLTDPLRSMLMANRPLDELMTFAEERDALVQFPRYASFLMEQQLIGPAESLLAVAT